jgi:hypothetical protein
MEQYRIKKDFLTNNNGMTIKIIVEKWSWLYKEWFCDVTFIQHVTRPNWFNRLRKITYKEKCEMAIKNLLNQANQYIEHKTEGDRIAEKLDKEF